MRSLGAFLIVMGSLSYVLPEIGMQFRLIEVVEKIHPNAGMAFIVVGAIVVVLGLLFDRPGQQGRQRVEVKVDNTAPAPRSGGFAKVFWFLVVVGVLIGGGYYAETKYGVFEKAKVWIEKEWKKSQGSDPQPSIGGNRAGEPTGFIEPKTQPNTTSSSGTTTSYPTDPKSTGSHIDPIGGVQIPGPFDSKSRTVVIDD